jgi:hypothetical protein
MRFVGFDQENRTYVQAPIVLNAGPPRAMLRNTTISRDNSKPQAKMIPTEPRDPWNYRD